MVDYADPAALAALGSAMMGIMGIFYLAIYIFMALALMGMAKKTNTPHGWLGFVPIGNIYLMTQIAKLPWWYLLLTFVPLVGMFIVFYLWWKMAESLGKPGWWCLLLLVPVVNLVIIGILAWGK